MSRNQTSSDMMSAMHLVRRLSMILTKRHEDSLEAFLDDWTDDDLSFGDVQNHGVVVGVVSHLHEETQRGCSVTSQVTSPKHSKNMWFWSSCPRDASSHRLDVDRREVDGSAAVRTSRECDTTSDSGSGQLFLQHVVFLCVLKLTNSSFQLLRSVHRPLLCGTPTCCVMYVSSRPASVFDQCAYGCR